MEGAINLAATRQTLVAELVTDALSSREWVDSDQLLDRIRRRHGWATDREVWSALDQLHEDGMIDSRMVERRDSIGRSVSQTQWRFLA